MASRGDAPALGALRQRSLGMMSPRDALNPPRDFTSEFGFAPPASGAPALAPLAVAERNISTAPGGSRAAVAAARAAGAPGFSRSLSRGSGLRAELIPGRAPVRRASETSSVSFHGPTSGRPATAAAKWPPRMPRSMSNVSTLSHGVETLVLSDVEEAGGALDEPAEEAVARMRGEVARLQHALWKTQSALLETYRGGPSLAVGGGGFKGSHGAFIGKQLSANAQSTGAAEVATLRAEGKALRALVAKLRADAHGAQQELLLARAGVGTSRRPSSSPVHNLWQLGSAEQPGSGDQSGAEVTPPEVRALPSSSSSSS
jgi:hypothetical protein